MFGLDGLEALYVVNAFLFQIILIIHFALRKWRFKTAMRLGPLIYSLCIPSALVSVALLLGGKTWLLWLAGFLFLIWGAFGYIVEYIQKIQWRSPIRWGIFVPYILLYLATTMFYWWPLGLLHRPLWYAYAVLFIISTILNIRSHSATG